MVYASFLILAALCVNAHALSDKAKAAIKSKRHLTKYLETAPKIEKGKALELQAKLAATTYTSGYVQMSYSCSKDDCGGKCMMDYQVLGMCLAGTTGNYVMYTAMDDGAGLLYVTTTVYSDSTCTTMTNTDMVDMSTTCVDGGMSSVVNSASIGSNTLTWASFATLSDCNGDKNSDLVYASVYPTGTCFSDDDGGSSYKITCSSDSGQSEGFDDDSTCSGAANDDYSIDDDVAFTCTLNPADDDFEIVTYERYFCKGGSSSDDTCFAGSDSVLLESGEKKLISDVVVGDRVQAFSSKLQQTVFSDVVAVPHERNDIDTMFVQITTAHGDSVKMTPRHLVLSGSCSAPTSTFALTNAESVVAGSCVITATQSDAVMVSSVKNVREKGIYSIVTREEFVVVGNVVASPFAVNHLVADLFYNIHRSMLGETVVQKAVVAVANSIARQVVSLTNMPSFTSIFGQSA